MLGLLLMACSGERTVSGHVLDVWDKPIDNATVVIEGVVERHYSGASGAFTIQVPEDQAVARVMAGRDGYIREILEVPAVAEGEPYAPLTFHLYPEPENPGFYGVGRSAYVHLSTARVTLVGTELRHYTGIKEIPAEALPSGTTRFVFSSTLRSSELSRMNLHLSRLDFVDHTRLKGILGPIDATVNLFVSAEEIPFDLKSLPSRDDYLIVTRAPLTTPGIYAFHAQDVLNEEDPRVILNLPKEMQVVFPFEVQ